MMQKTAYYCLTTNYLIPTTKSQKLLLLYNLALRAYALLLRLLAPLVPKAAAWVAGRRGLLAHIAQTIGPDPAPVCGFIAPRWANLSRAARSSKPTGGRTRPPKSY